MERANSSMATEETLLLKAERIKQVGRQCVTDQTWHVAALVGSIAVYLLTGTIVFSAAERWPVFDSFYFCVVTMSTVGYGSPSSYCPPGVTDKAECARIGQPSQPSTKLFCIVYSALGIFIMLDRISSLLSSIYTSTQAKLNALAEERDEMQATTATTTTPPQGRGAAEAVEEPVAAWRFHGRQVVLYGSLMLLWLLLSAAVFCSLSPGLSYIDAVYFSWISASTIGYGDDELTTEAARGYGCFFILMSTAIITLIGSGVTAENAARAWMQRRWQIHRQSSGEASLLDEDLLFRLQTNAKVDRSADPAGGKVHDELTFLVTMLDHLELVRRADCKLILGYFRHLDADRSGTLSMEELWVEHRRVVARQSEQAPGTKQPTVSP